MRILQVDANEPWNQSNVWGLAKAYKKRGDWKLFDYRRMAYTIGERAMNEHLVRVADKFRPDVVHIEKGETVWRWAIPKLRELDARVMHIFPDYREDALPFLKASAKYMDWTLLTHKDPVWAEAMYPNKVAFWTRGVDPDVFKPHDVEKRYDVVMVANNALEWRCGRGKGRRDLFLRHLIDNGLTVHVFGKHVRKDAARFPSVVPHEHVDLDRLAEVVSQTKVSLAYNACDVPMFCSWRRVFNTLAAGGFLLINYFPGLERVLKNSEHLVWFRTWDEALALVRHYLDSPEERERIAAAGREEVIEHHNWDRRVEYMMHLAFEDRAEPPFARFGGER